jgi:hypothetical protein
MNIFHHLHRHAKTAHTHVKKHHKHYLTGMFGSYAIVKIFIFVVARLSFLPQFHDTFAENISGCMMSGEYFTGTVQVCTTADGIWTGGTEVCTITQEGYLTGGALDESGNLVGQTSVDPIQSCELTGQIYLTGATSCIDTGGYWTGGTQICTTADTGAIATGATVATGDTTTGATTQYQLMSLNNGICDAGDYTWIMPNTGALLSGTIAFAWTGESNDCANSALTLQLYDHNKQRITLGNVSAGMIGYNFDSSLLSGRWSSTGVLLSGLYHVLNGTSVIYTGIASGAYLPAGTGYQVRLSKNSTIIATSPLFTIDNQAPSMTGITRASTGYKKVGDEVSLSFTASESLSGLIVMIGTGEASLDDQQGLRYTYTKTLSTGDTE